MGRVDLAVGGTRPCADRGRRDQSGTVSLELVLLIPVLMLLTLFVLWAGRGGRAALTADLAAEEAATAAALCCDEDDAGAADRETVAEDVLESRPGLEFLCVGGLRPNAEDDAEDDDEPLGFVREEWLEFEPGRTTGGVGILGVQFMCESDGAVAPLRGLFPTVTFHGQASEIVLREARLVAGFDPTETSAPEGTDLVFTVTLQPSFGEEVTLSYGVYEDLTTAQLADFGVAAFADLGGTVTITADQDSSEITIPVVDDDFYDDGEQLVLVLTGAPPGVTLDDDRLSATGTITDNDPRPLLQFVPPNPEVDEGGDPSVPDDGYLVFTLRIGDDQGALVQDIAEELTVQVATVAGPAALGEACESWVRASQLPCDWATAGSDYLELDETVTFRPRSLGLKLEHEVRVSTVDDRSSPEGEQTEVVLVSLTGETGTDVGVRDGHRTRGGRILDDEARLSVADVEATEGEPLNFELELVPPPAAEVVVGYRLQDDPLAVGRGATLGDDCSAAGVDYLRWRDPGTGTFTAEGTVRVPGGTQRIAVPPVVSCDDSVVEPDETFWLEVWVVSGEAIEAPSPPDDGGARGRIVNDDIPVVSIDPIADSGDEGDTLAFRVRLTVDGSPAVLTDEVDDVTVGYVISGGTATAHDDFEPLARCSDAAHTTQIACVGDGDTWTPEGSLTGTLTFPAGTPAADQTIEVELSPDYLLEPDPETFRLVLERPTGAVLFDREPGNTNPDEPYAQGTITDDPPPVLSVSGFVGREGDTREFTVSLADPRAGEDVTVGYVISGGTATAHDDFEPLARCSDAAHTTQIACVGDGDTWTPEGSLTGTLTFPAGTPAADQTIEVELSPDYLLEPDPETFRLVLEHPTGAVLFDREPGNTNPDEPYAQGTITDDPPPVLSVSGFVGREGDTREFTVSLADPRAGEDVTVGYVISGGTATAHDDFEPLARCSDAAHATQIACEGDDDTWTPEGSLTGTLTFPSGTIGRTVGVRLKRDTILNEGNETLRLTLSSPDRAVLGDSDSITPGDQFYGVGTITEIDPPWLTVDNPDAVLEGEQVQFTVTLCNAFPGVSVTVDYHTENRSARAGALGRGDFDHIAAGTLMFDSASEETAPHAVAEVCGDRGVTARSLPPPAVQTHADTIAENPEWFALVLSGQTPTNQVGIGKAIGSGTITNVNRLSVVVSDPTAQQEGGTLQYVISLVDEEDQPAIPTAAQPVTVHYATENGTATAETGPDCTSGSGGDYIAVARTPVTLTQDNPTRTVPVTTCTDTIDEDDETVKLLLSRPSPNATIGDGQGTGTIIDQPPPYIRIDNPAAVREGETVTFTVSLVGEDGRPRSTSETVTVDYVTSDRTATAGLDYARTPTSGLGTVTFDPGDTAKPIPVRTIADDTWETEETFRLDLSDAKNAILDKAAGTGRIRANCIMQTDPAGPTITAHDLTYVEHADRVSYDISFSRPLCEDFWIQHRFVPITAQCADMACGAPGHTYPNPGWRRPAAASEAERMTVTAVTAGLRDEPPPPGSWVVNDDLDEDTETYYFEVTWGDDMPLRWGREWVSGLFTIIDDDPEPRLSISDEAAPAGEAMTFNVELDAPSGRTVTVDYRFENITAEAGDDYSAAPGRVTFTPDATTGSTGTVERIVVPTEANTSGEGDEAFRVVLESAVHAGFADNIGIGTILAGAGPRLSISDAVADEGDTMSFAVRLSPAAAQPVTVGYATVQRPQGPEGAATENSDYVPKNGTVTFVAGDDEELIEFIEVTIKDDGDTEPPETFLVELSNQSSGVSLADRSAVGTINGDVPCVDRRVSSGHTQPTPRMTSATSFDEDAGQVTITVAVETPFCQSVSISPRTHPEHGTATRDVDYIEPRASQDERLGALQSEFSFPLVLIDDDIVEGDEQIALSVQFAREYSVYLPVPGHGVQADLTIIDDDAATLQLPAADAPATAAEGGYLSFVARLDRPTVQPVTFDYATADGSAPAAAAGADYESTSDTAEIPPGELSVTIPVRTIEDALDEHDENVELRISDLAGAEPDPGGSVAFGRITDDDDPPAVEVSNPSADEGDALVFEVTLDAPSGRAASVSYSTSNGSATAGNDYASASGTLTFTAGQTAKTVPVQALFDDEIEGAERFSLNLSSSVLRFDDDRGTGTIRDVTDRRVTVSDAYVVEGGALGFEVGFDGPPSSRDITLRYTTVSDAALGDTAAAGDDYRAEQGGLRIIAGETSAVVTVATVDDALDEDAERLRLVLSDPAGAVLVDGEAVGVIIDNDPVPGLSVDDPEATENGDGTPIAFTVRLSEASGRNVTVRYSTADGTAKEGDDYIAASDEEVTIPAGSDTGAVPVMLVDDAAAEPVETFWLVLSGPSNAGLDDTTGVGRILDDDGPIQILVDDPEPVQEAEGASVTFTVRLSRASPDEEVTVTYATEDATATAGGDYTADTGPLAFAAGDIEKTVTIMLVNDDDAEDVETFRLRLSSPSSNAELGDDSAVAVAVIRDDDGLPTLSVADSPPAPEGASASFAVRLSRASAQEVTVVYAAVVDPFAGEAAATPGQDFDAVAGTLTIPARAASATVAVPLPDDALDEHTETFWLRLADPTGATVDGGTATGTISDNDPLPLLSVADTGATEGRTLRFMVRLNAPSGRTVTVPWTTAVRSIGDPASPTDDYIAASGTLTFPSGTTTASIVIATVDDEVSEPDETFWIRLGEPTYATVDDGVAVGAIRDDDGLPRISIAGTKLTEDESPAIFVVRLSRRSSRPVTVAYSSGGGTATPGADYAVEGGARGTLTFPAGSTRGEISVYVVDDNIAEGTETFRISLSDPVNAVIAEGAGTAVGVIVDDDLAGITIGGAQASEGDGTIVFPVTLSPPSADGVSVRYTTFDGSAAQPGDYTAVSDTLTIAPETTAAAIAVTLTDDPFVEDAESFLVRLSDPTGAELAAAEAIGVILDDDALPVISLPDYTSFREDAGTISLRLTLDRASDREVRVDYATGTHSPTHCDVPYVPASGTVVFPPGSVAEEFEITLVDDQEQCAHSFGDQTRRTFRVNLTNPQNATFRTDIRYDWFTGLRVTYQILTDHIAVSVWDIEALPCIGSVGPAGILEDAGTAVFTSRLNYVSDADVRFRVYTATTIVREWTEFQALATSNVDYTALDTILTILAGSMSTDVAVTILDDSLVEDAEGFRLVARAVENVRHECVSWLHGGADAWIIDDDAPPQLSVGDVDVAENAGTAAFAVSLDRVSASDITVNYATADDTATEPDDYTETSSTLQIDAGLTIAFVEVPLIDDTDTEEDETFTLQLSDPSGADIGEGQATATIRDDESVGLPSLSVADAAGSDNDGRLRLLVMLSEPSTDDVTFRVSTVAVPSLGDRAATPSTQWNNFTGDYHPLNGEYEYTIVAGRTETYVPVFLTQYDRTPEFDEMFRVVLHDPMGATLGKASAWATILDDDTPIVTIDDARVLENAGSMSFTVRLHEPGVYRASLRYTTLVSSSAGDAAATPDEDYAHSAGVVYIPVGQTTATVTVPISGDSIDELDEVFLLELSDAVALQFSDTIAVGTIVDDDPGWWIDDPSVWEYSATMDFTVNRDHTSTSAVTLNYRIAAAGSAVGGTDCAVDGVDYLTPSGSVTLQPSDTQAAISLELCNDTVAEGLETLVIELVGVTGRKLTGVGTITDDD